MNEAADWGNFGSTVMLVILAFTRTTRSVVTGTLQRSPARFRPGAIICIDLSVGNAAGAIDRECPVPGTGSIQGQLFLLKSTKRALYPYASLFKVLSRKEAVN